MIVVVTTQDENATLNKSSVLCEVSIQDIGDLFILYNQIMVLHNFSSFRVRSWKMEHCGYIWAGVAQSTFSSLDRVQKHQTLTVKAHLATSPGLNRLRSTAIPLVRSMFYSDSFFIARWGRLLHGCFHEHYTLKLFNSRVSRLSSIFSESSLPTSFISPSSFISPLTWVALRAGICWTSVKKLQYEVI